MAPILKISTTDIFAGPRFFLADQTINVVSSLFFEERLSMATPIFYKRAGVTRSGKLIPYATSSDEISDLLRDFRDPNFSHDDLFDAFAVFDFLALRAIRRGDDAIFFSQLADGVFDLLGPENFSEAKARANLRSAFDLRDLGQSLVAVEFSNF